MPKGSRVQDTINRLNVGSPAPHKRISLTPRGTESKLRAPRVSRAISRDDSALDALQPPPIRARNNSDPLSPRIRAPPKVPPRPPQPLVSKIPKQFLQKFDSPLRNASSSLEKSNKAASKHASDLPQAQRRQHGRAANDSKKKKVGNLRSKTPPARAGERKGNKRNPPDLSRSGSQRLLMFRGEGEKSSSIASDENINDDYRTSDDGLPTPKCRPPPPPNIKQQKKKRPPALPSSTTEEEQQYSSSSSSTSNGGGPRKKPPPIPASILLRKRSKNRLLPAAPANDSRSSSGANDAANIERTRHSSIYQGGNRERDSRLERVKTAPFLLGDSSCPPTPPRTRPARRGRGGQGNPPPLPMRRPTIHSKSQARGPPLPERRTKERKSIAPLQNLQRIPSLGGFDFDISSSTSASGGGGNLSLSQRSTGFIGFAHYLARRSGKEHLTASNRVFYLNWAGTSSMMQCRFKQAARLGDKDGKDARGETLFSCIRLQSIGGGTVHKRGSVGGVVAEEWRYTNWDRQQAIASFDGVVFKTRLRSSADGKAATGKELRFLNHNQERCRLEKQSLALLQFGGGSAAAGGVEVPEGGCESKAAATAAADTARMMRRTNKRMSGVMTITGREAKLPRYTFRETAQQIEKDRAIFAQMGVDSSQLAFDGLLKAEFGHRAKPGPCSTVRDVTRKVENLISSGTLAFEGGADLAKLLKLEGCTWREANHPEFLFIQYRVAGDPRSLAIPRKILQDEKRVYVGLKKLVPVVRLTCADLVDRLVEVPSSRLSENFFLTLPYHSAPDYVLHLLLKRTYPEIDSPWRPRIFAHLKAWIKEYPEDFCSNRSLVQELLEDAKEISKLTTAESAFHDKMSKRVLDAMENAMESLDLEESVPYYMYPTFLPRDEAKDYDDFSIHLLSQQQHVKVLGRAVNGEWLTGMMMGGVIVVGVVVVVVVQR
mmetsp:Transcript_29982/g.48068  ORF Transcript_29982/g.48068 Transcript_29982/m.48068 type:complete len:942 (-) Transcript_29982:41-2866(-)